MSYFCFLTDSFVNHIVIWDHFLLGSKGQILQTRLPLLQVDVAKTTIEEDLTRIQFELEA